MTERPEEAPGSEPSTESEALGRVEARREGAPGYDMAEEEAYAAEEPGEKEPDEGS